MKYDSLVAKDNHSLNSDLFKQHCPFDHILISSITTLEFFHLKATIPSLFTRKSLSSRLKDLSEVNDATKASSFVFFFFFDLSSATLFFASAAAFFFAGVSIFDKSSRFCLTTPIPYNEFYVNSLMSDDEVKKLSKKIRLKLPFNFSVRCRTTDSLNPNSVVSFLPVQMSSS